MEKTSDTIDEFFRKWDRKLYEDRTDSSGYNKDYTACIQAYRETFQVFLAEAKDEVDKRRAGIRAGLKIAKEERDSEKGYFFLNNIIYLHDKAALPEEVSFILETYFIAGAMVDSWIKYEGEQETLAGVVVYLLEKHGFHPATVQFTSAGNKL